MHKYILLIEEDEDRRRLLQYGLSKHGYTVVAAADDSEALEWAASLRFDLVLGGELRSSLPLPPQNVGLAGVLQLLKF